MKKTTLIFLLLALLLSACSPKTGADPALNSSDSYVSSNLDSSYENALSVRNQLIIGTLQLADTEWAVSSEQAQTLLPLWQALLATQKSGTAAQAETNALLEQIEGSLTPEQLAAISAMMLTQESMQSWAAANGITLGSGTGNASGQPGQGPGRNLSADERATRQAQEGVTASSGGGGASTALLTAVIAYLESLLP